jgi:NitT/TauT family transport system substrate-binding protein
MQGWQYMIDHPDEAVKIVMAADTAGVLQEAHQKRMISEVAKLIPGSTHGLGYLEPAAYDRTVKELLSTKSDPVIAKEPQGAFTHAVWDKAFAH